MYLRRHTDVLKIPWCFFAILCASKCEEPDCSLLGLFLFSPPTRWKENLPFSACGASFNLEFNGKAEFVLLPAEGQSNLSAVCLRGYQNSSVSQHCAWGFLCFHTAVSSPAAFLYTYLETSLRQSLEYISAGGRGKGRTGCVDWGYGRGLHIRKTKCELEGNKEIGIRELKIISGSKGHRNLFLSIWLIRHSSIFLKYPLII